MRTLFHSYYRPTEKEFETLWHNCVFVIDTNVLLNLYRYPKQAREDLLALLRQTSDRLWIPHQAALEYQRNRLAVIADQMKRFAEVRSHIEETSRNLRDGLDRLQVRKRHSSIATDDFLAKIDTAIEDFITKLDSLEKEQPDVFAEDDLRIMIDSILGGKVGPPPVSQEALDDLYALGRARYESGIPPGYADISKSKGDHKEPQTFVHNQLVFKREYGDWLLWHEILREAQARSWSSVIFVTDDEKDDWWWTVESKGKKRIGPRPELVEEITSKSGVKSFYMYNSERYLEYAKKYLQAQVDQLSIEQVREVARTQRTERATQSPVPSYWGPALHAVYRWLERTLPNDVILVQEGGFPNYVSVNGGDGRRTGYEVYIYIRGHASRFPIALRETADRGADEISSGKLATLSIVLVIQPEDDAGEIERAVRAIHIGPPDLMSVIVGRLVPTDEQVRFPYMFLPLLKI